jgi:hypothetical protein
VRPNYQQLRDSNAVELVKAVFGPPGCMTWCCRWSATASSFATVHVGVRTTLLRALYQPQLTPALTLMGLALGLRCWWPSCWATWRCGRWKS